MTDYNPSTLNGIGIVENIDLENWLIKILVKENVDNHGRECLIVDEVEEFGCDGKYMKDLKVGDKVEFTIIDFLSEDNWEIDWIEKK